MFKQRVATAALVLVAVLALSSPALAAVHFQNTGGTQPTVRSTTVLGNVVLVTVTNPGRDPRTVTVQVVAVVHGGQVSSSATLSVPPRSDASAPVDCGGPVDGVVEVGLQEDANPL